jgi:hypothetical protein
VAGTKESRHIGAVPSVVAVQRSVSHRVRVLLHTAPLHELKAHQGRVAGAERHYDTMELAVHALDRVIDRMGLDAELDRKGLAIELSPLLDEMDRRAGVSPDPARHQSVIDRVVGGLRNDSERRQPFAVEYGDVDELGRWVRRRLEFRLVEDRFHPSGRTVLALSSAAVNLYLGALELDIEDAQAATEAVIQSQLARGRIAEAVESARQARWQSIRYREKIDRLLRDTRRDVASVDWRRAVPALLGEALGHVSRRLDVEGGIRKAAFERLEVLEEAPGGSEEPERADGRNHLVEVATIVEECARRHTQLHGDLMGARDVFLVEQARQRFVPAPARFVPELPADVLEPILRLAVRPAVAVLDGGVPALLGARAPGLVSLADLVCWQLRPRRAAGTGDVVEQEVDPAEPESELARFPAAVRAAARRRVEGVEGSAMLSRLLEEALASTFGEELAEAVALVVLEEFAPEDVAKVDVRRAGTTLAVAGFYGDELEVRGRDAGRVG